SSTGSFHSTATLTIANTGAATDTFQLAAIPRDPTAPVPQFSAPNVQLAAGASADVSVTFSADNLAPGQYEGFIAIQGAQSSIPTQVPYWCAGPSGTPAYITVLSADATGSAGASLT